MESNRKPTSATAPRPIIHLFAGFRGTLVNANIIRFKHSINAEKWQSSSAQHCHCHCRRDVYVCEAAIITTTSRHGPSGRDGLTFSKFSLGKSYAMMPSSTLVKWDVHASDMPAHHCTCSLYKHDVAYSLFPAVLSTSGLWCFLLVTFIYRYARLMEYAHDYCIWVIVLSSKIK